MCWKQSVGAFMTKTLQESLLARRPGRPLAWTFGLFSLAARSADGKMALSEVKAGL